MGFILPEIYQSISSDFDREVPKIFIETGTYMGGVPHRMLETYGTLQPFDKIYTIELGEDICKVASKRYKSYIENDGDLNKFNFHANEKDDSLTFCGSRKSHPHINESIIRIAFKNPQEKDYVIKIIIYKLNPLKNKGGIIEHLD